MVVFFFSQKFVCFFVFFFFLEKFTCHSFIQFFGRKKKHNPEKKTAFSFIHSIFPKSAQKRTFPCKKKIRYLCPEEVLIIVTENMRYPENIGVLTVMGVQYNRLDYGGQGNCLFLAVAGGLRFFFGPSKYDHRYLRQAVSDW